MVQFKPVETSYHSSRRRYSRLTYNRLICNIKNSYWKLGLYSYRGKTIKNLIQYLKDEGYECREKISRPGVIDAIGRHQRGLMSYEGCSVDELQAFCKARGLPAKATTASRLARALETADDLATFPRFLDLPAELRNAIYELHFHGFDSFNGEHVQPPLTMASRQLRSETLPLFYDCATFHLSATSIHVGRPGVRRPATSIHAQRPEVCRPPPESIRILSCFTYMPAASFACINRFDLHWRSVAATKVKVEVAMRFTVTSEPANSSSLDLTLEDALVMGLESKFRTVKNARQMLERGDQPMTMSISGDVFNTTQARSDQSGRHVSIGDLMLQNVRID